jgi:hypothetical protein
MNKLYHIERFCKNATCKSMLPNTTCTPPNRCQALDCEGIGFAVGRMSVVVPKMPPNKSLLRHFTQSDGK